MPSISTLLVDLFNANLLVNWVDVHRRAYLWRGNRYDGLVVRVVLFHNGNGGVSIITATSASPVRDNGKDPEHADEDTDTAADNKGDSPTLPAAEIHERMVEPRQKGAVMLVVHMMRAIRHIASPITTLSSRNRREGENANEIVITAGSFIVRRLAMRVVGVVFDFNQRPTERLSEAVPYLDRLYLDLVNEDGESGFFAMTAFAMAETLGGHRFAAVRSRGR